MSAIDDLSSQISDESLHERIRAEIKRANRQKRFGPVFEKHLAETTPLYNVADEARLRCCLKWCYT